MNRRASQAATVLVIGSANIDVAVTAPRLPRPGETVSGDRAIVSLGGKGANQAIAAALAGADVQLAARIGGDEFGRMVREAVLARGVGADELATVAGASTGLAAIYVDASGQNCIVVVPGANALLTPTVIQQLAPRIESAAIVVLQCEIPLESVVVAIRIAAAAGVPVVLNPAPVGGLVRESLPAGISYLVPNETEATALTGLPITGVDEAQRCAQRLHAGGVECAIVTLGAQGCVAADRTGVRHFAARRVHAIDTTGAGDAFVGCLAAALVQGHVRDAAIERALVFAALSTTRSGAQVSYPDRASFESAVSACPYPE